MLSLFDCVCCVLLSNMSSAQSAWGRVKKQNVIYQVKNRLKRFDTTIAEDWSTGQNSTEEYRTDCFCYFPISNVSYLLKGDHHKGNLCFLEGVRCMDFSYNVFTSVGPHHSHLVCYGSSAYYNPTPEYAKVGAIL